jgi:sulfite reductase alpha subunit-like flavoprotein
MTAPARRALVVYGSETGTAQDVAEELGRIAERLRFDTHVADLDAIGLVCTAVHRRPESNQRVRSNCCNTLSF